MIKAAKMRRRRILRYSVWVDDETHRAEFHFSGGLMMFMRTRHPFSYSSKDPSFIAKCHIWTKDDPKNTYHFEAHRWTKWSEVALKRLARYCEWQHRVELQNGISLLRNPRMLNKRIFLYRLTFADRCQQFRYFGITQDGMEYEIAKYRYEGSMAPRFSRKQYDGTYGGVRPYKWVYLDAFSNALVAAMAAMNLSDHLQRVSEHKHIVLAQE